MTSSVSDPDPFPVNAENVGAVNLYFAAKQASQETKESASETDGTSRERSLKDLIEDLGSLPPHLHPFRDPRHDRLLSDIEERRLLLLTSYQEFAAYAAAHSLVNDDFFQRQLKKSLSLTHIQDEEHPGLHLLALSGEEVLGETPQILLIEIKSKCTLLDSALELGSKEVGNLRDRLENQSSYLVLAIDEDLLRDENRTARARGSLPYYAISHLRYLLSRDLADRAEDLEKRLVAAIKRGASPIDLCELQQHVANRLAESVAAFEEFLRELEEATSLPLSVRKERFQPIQAQDVLREESEIHKAATFVATYFPDLGQRDFDRLVLLLLGDQTATVERTRQVVGRERWANRWLRDADRVFRDGHLRTMVAGDGSLIVDFSEPYLRRELRGYLERHFPSYVKRQSQALQDSGVLFAVDLSRTAVEGLVRLFVERAIADPTSFGSFWLFELVRGLRIQIEGDPPAGSPEVVLAWLLEKLAVEARLRAHFHERLALLIREMLDRETLRPMVREFFEFLIAAKQHDALLDVILELARRLRFAPHFDPLLWMRRLLDQGSALVREQTRKRLTLLARESGPRIYDFLGVIHSWLPEEGRSFGRFSVSNCLALNFPFELCLEIAKSLPPERFGAWPSRHPLFYALPDDSAAAREELGKFVAWLLDPRGAALETADATEAMRTAEVVRIGHIADLLEHWAWVLEGGSEEGPAEGRALFSVVVEEIDHRIGAKERSWLQRSWQRRQDDYLRQAANAATSGGPGRTLLVARRAKLDHLRIRFATLANQQGSASDASETKGGITS